MTPEPTIANEITVPNDLSACQALIVELARIVKEQRFLFTLTITYGDERKGVWAENEEQRIHEGRRHIVPLGCGIGGVVSRKRWAFVA